MNEVFVAARYVINRHNELYGIINNFRLQRILYFVQAEFLVRKKAVCFQNQIEAWETGPVVPEVYREYKIFGNAPIPTLNTHLPILEEEQELIDNVIKECAKYSSIELSDLSRRQKPWINAYNSLSNIISEKAIKEYFL